MNNVTTVYTNNLTVPAPTSLTVDSQSGLARVLAEQSGGTGSPVSASYSYQSAGSAQVMSLANSAGDRWMFSDALGSVRTLGDATGNVTDAKTFDGFGTPGPYASGTNPSPYGFAGERTDGSGLQWLRARWYAPEQGGFLTRDRFIGAIDLVGTRCPCGLESPRAAYPYARGNPVDRTDPTGLLDSRDLAVAQAGQATLRGGEATHAFYVWAWVVGLLSAAITYRMAYQLGYEAGDPEHVTYDEMDLRNDPGWAVGPPRRKSQPAQEAEFKEALRRCEQKLGGRTITREERRRLHEAIQSPAWDGRYPSIDEIVETCLQMFGTPRGSGG